MRWMIYGANGYTGRLVTDVALHQGDGPIVAGRSGEQIARLASALGLEPRVVGLDDPAGLRHALADVDMVVNCAGPFTRTAAPMIDACLHSGTHYLDVTGEIDVFEAVFARHDDAVRAGVVLLPGIGFDVVPTDCVAAMLAERLPSATHLDLAFSAGGGISPGTMKSAVEGAGAGGRARVDGKLVTVPVAHRHRTAMFGSRPRRVTAIPWGDLSTAYRSTGIPNITTFVAIPGGAIVGMGQRLVTPLMRRPLMRRAATAIIVRSVRGPDESHRANSGAEVWGEARDADGHRVTASLALPNVYSFTAASAVAAVAKLASRSPAPGAHTPSSAFGAGFVMELDGVTAFAP